MTTQLVNHVHAAPRTDALDIAQGRIPIGADGSFSGTISDVRPNGLGRRPAPASDSSSRTGARSYPNVDVVHEADAGIYWQFMRPQERPCYTHALMADAKAALDQAGNIAAAEPERLRYLVSGSRVPGIFNLGGDLPHFTELIARRDREGLRAYAYACIEVQHARAAKVAPGYLSIALVQGDALGGGFECALTDDVVIAEKGAKFGLPEVLFGLFPGMGAYSFLSRKLGDVAAENMILTGRIYSAEELHEMGLVTRLAEPGEGESAVYRFIREEQRSFRARTALSQIRQRVAPVSFAELADIAEIWVDTALTLTDAELRKMQRLAAAQDRRWRQIREGQPDASGVADAA